MTRPFFVYHNGPGLLDFLKGTILGTIRATRNEEEESSVSAPISAISSVPQFPAYGSTSSQQEQPFAIPVSTDLSKLQHSFSSVSTPQSSAPREEFYRPEQLLRSVDTGSIGLPKFPDSTNISVCQPKHSKKYEPVVDYTTIYAKPQCSSRSVAPTKDDQPAL